MNRSWSSKSWAFSVPERGIPLDVGAVVNNVGTLVNIADALRGQPVIDKYLSVAGEVDKPLMFKVPIGTPVTDVLNQAGLRISDYALILGGPMMGLMMVEPQKIASAVVTKTLGSLIVLPAGHIMVQTWRLRQNLDRLRHQTKSACIQCRMCTDLCPRYLIGHQMRPHLVMRNFWREDAITDPAEYVRAFGDAVNCCDCGICEEFACPMGLSPRKVNDHFKQMIRQKGLTVERNLKPAARLDLNERRTPTLRLVARLGLTAYEGRHATECRELSPDSVFIPSDSTSANRQFPSAKQVSLSGAAICLLRPIQTVFLPTSTAVSMASSRKSAQPVPASAGRRYESNGERNRHARIHQYSAGHRGQ